MAIELAQEPSFGMARHMARMMDQMQLGFFEYSPAQNWTPNINLYEADTAYLICVDLAGVEKEKIDLTVSEGVLRFRGQRAAPEAPCDGGSRCRIHLMEIDHGCFSREMELPADADHAGITASHDNGLLWIRIPKRPVVP